MKYAKAHPKTLYGYSLLTTIVIFFLIEWATKYVVEAYRLHWFILIVIITLCFSPFGHQKIVATPDEKPMYAFWPWLWRLFTLQAALFFVFLGMTLVFSHWLPVGTKPNAFVIRNTLSMLLKHDGLLPWGVYALYAAGFAYVSYIKNQDAHPSSLVSPLLHQSPSSLFSTALNLSGRASVFSTIVMTFSFMTLLFASIITSKSMPLLTGFHGKTLIIILALIIFGFTPPFKKIVKILLNPKIPLPFMLATAVIVFALLIWLLNSFLGSLGQGTTQIPQFIQWMTRKNPLTLWIIFSVVWWIGWTPLIAAHIAKLSRGHRIRSMIFATLALPFGFTLLLTAFPRLLFASHLILLPTSILSLIAFFYLLNVLMEKTNLPMIIRGYLPKRGEYKRRDHYFYFRKVFQLMFITLYLYLPAGISITIYLSFFLTLLFTLQIPFATTYLLGRFKSTP